MTERAKHWQGSTHRASLHIVVVTALLYHALYHPYVPYTSWWTFSQPAGKSTLLDARGNSSVMETFRGSKVARCPPTQKRGWLICGDPSADWRDSHSTTKMKRCVIPDSDKDTKDGVIPLLFISEKLILLVIYFWQPAKIFRDVNLQYNEFAVL